MVFNNDAQLNTSNVSRGGGGSGPGRGAVLGGGGGILGVVGLIIYMLLGGNPADLQQQPVAQQPAGAQGQDAGDLVQKCKTGADANKYAECRIIGTQNSVEAFWREKLAEQSGGQRQWQDTRLVIYNEPTQSQCGTASNDVGPFYCPLDKSVYLDASFFDILHDQFGSSKGALAQEYVVAHEYGHALQDQLGLLGRAQQDPKGAESGGVRVELMADCFAGMWARHAATTKDDRGNTFLEPITQSQINDALSAAEAVGDDRIMKRTQGRVSPENFTHGSSEQRQRWFMTGYQSSDINACNTFDAPRL
ncbi:KPN_02809 family neutral zinc metallopeptidase [Gephyromycinifex aptenodytis]|uniref:KPN_02809 family neutral zinc metallopeptidase n=1 Tax=Gephyromycinifex aptenodytis TaxID=2716227 RepID=UPI0014479F47|nr:neutral zinc metallopeptidase [Gephyromycinifex aptenodytis]